MQYRFFHIRATDPLADSAALNAFIQASPVTSVDRQFVVDGEQLWAEHLTIVYSALFMGFPRRLDRFGDKPKARGAEVGTVPNPCRRAAFYSRCLKTPRVFYEGGCNAV